MKYLVIVILLAFLAGLSCLSAIRRPPAGTPVPAVTASLAILPSSTPSSLAELLPTATPVIPDTGWQPVKPGLERRLINLFNDQGQWVEHIYLLRLEPGPYQVGLAYDERQPRSLSDWQAETGALIVVNGGYYRVEGEKLIPTGLIIVDGQAIGQSYDSFAGMLAVTATGPELRWLQQQPYDPDESLLAGLQSFPLLVKPGGELGFPAQYEDNRKARRTVIGQDRAGRLLFMVAGRGHFTLHQLSVYLVNSDLELDIALNLDGGPSSGLLLAEPAEGTPALSPLPVVITVHPRPEPG
jgi:hypothetical protein